MATEARRPEALPPGENRGVKFLGNCRLVDVLGEWGSHNTGWRLGREVTDVLDGVDVALTYYAPLVSRIVSAIPFDCVRAEFTAEDLPLINIADGRLMTDWTTAVEQDPTRSGEYVRTMAAAIDPIMGPLVCSCVGEIVGGELQLRSPFVVFDGWHRGAAWVLHGRAKRVYSIAGRIIVTRYPAPLLGQTYIAV